VFDILDVFRCLEAQAKQPFVWLRESPWVACLGARLKWKWGYLCCGKPFCLFACQKTLADFCGAPMFEKSLKGRIEGWTRKDMGTSRPWCIPRGFFKTPLNENWADMLPLHCCDLFILYLDIYIYTYSHQESKINIGAVNLSESKCRKNAKQIRTLMGDNVWPFFDCHPFVQLDIPSMLHWQNTRYEM
jgi:hypothetical protein